jgi:hypothetical protein
MEAKNKKQLLERLHKKISLCFRFHFRTFLIINSTFFKKKSENEIESESETFLRNLSIINSNNKNLFSISDRLIPFSEFRFL